MWVELDLEPDSFWDRSPREVNLILEARIVAKTKERNLMAWHAWNTAAMIRAKQMPRLQTLLVKEAAFKAKPRQSWQEQFSIMERWATRMAAVRK